jgi:hypothetical protein
MERMAMEGEPRALRIDVRPVPRLPGRFLPGFRSYQPESAGGRRGA